MFRFSIRELMLVTLVVALSVGWAIDHWRPNNPCLQAELRNMTMEEALKLLGYEVEQDVVARARSQKRTTALDKQ